MKKRSASGGFAGTMLLFGFAPGLLVSAAASAQTAADPAVTATPPPVAPAAVARPPVRWTVAQLQLAFAAADTDGNGELSRAEAQQLVILPRAFEELDQNKDGVLSSAEYAAILRPR